MAKKKKRNLPYRKFRIYFSRKTGKQVKSTYRGKKRIAYGYISKLTGNRIGSSVLSRDSRTQGLREAFPDYRKTVKTKYGRYTKIVRRTDRTRKKIAKTIKEFKEVGFNPLEASPSLGRYFTWLKKNKPRLYRAAVRAADLQGNVEDLSPEDIENYQPARRRKKKRRGR